MKVKVFGKIRRIVRALSVPKLGMFLIQFEGEGYYRPISVLRLEDQKRVMRALKCSGGSPSPSGSRLVKFSLK